MDAGHAEGRSELPPGFGHFPGGGGFPGRLAAGVASGLGIVDVRGELKAGRSKPYAEKCAASGSRRLQEEAAKQRPADRPLGPGHDGRPPPGRPAGARPPGHRTSTIFFCLVAGRVSITMMTAFGLLGAWRAVAAHLVAVMSGIMVAFEAGRDVRIPPFRQEPRGLAARKQAPGED